MIDEDKEVGVIMPLALPDIFKIPMIKDYKVLTNGIPLDSISVASVSVLGPPAESWARKNELVLTTAISNNKKLNSFRLFLHDIVNSRAAAVMITFENDVPVDIPVSIISYMEDSGVPLILIPWEYRFSEILEEILDRIRYREVHIHEKFETLKNDLLLYYINGKILKEVVKLLAETLLAEIHIVDLDYKIIASSDLSESETLLEKNMSSYNLRTEIRGEENLYGYFIASQNKIVDPPAFSIELFNQHIVPSLALWFERGQVMVDERQKITNDFVWSLAMRNWSSWETMVFRANLFSFNLALPYVCIAGKPIRVSPEKNSDPEDLILWTERNVDLLIREVRTCAKHINAAAMIAYYKDTIIVFLDISPNPSEQFVGNFLDMIDRRLSQNLPEVEYLWGISEFSTENTDFRKRYINAKLALDICFNEKMTSRRSTYKDANIYKVLSALNDNPEIEEVVSEVLGKILRYEKARNIDLIRTFLAYMQNDYNASKTAKILHLHRQSLLYRLDKIIELSKCDIRKSEERFLLALCIRIHMSGLFLSS
jgi:purine catabolism regulator